jgi:hypothetical protein
MRKFITLFAVLGMVLALAPAAQAELVITVTENGGNVDFSWNGTIGDSGSTNALPAGSPAADQIEPSTGQVQLGDRTKGDLSETFVGSGIFKKWTPSSVYAGDSFAYGSGLGTAPGDGFSTFLTTQNISFRVIPNTHSTHPGDLLVGFTDQANTAGTVDLANDVFTGSFSLPGTFATYGLFDTGPSALPCTLWTSTGGAGGSIVFQAPAATGTPGTLVYGK